jgi:hypothetical protein
MSKLGEALGELRIMAKRYEGTWQLYHLSGGLRLAWKVEGDVHHLLLGREGVMPSPVEERVVLASLPTGLLPVSCEREEEKCRVYWVLKKGAVESS